MKARKWFRCFGINFRPIFYVLAVMVILGFARFLVVTRVDRRQGLKNKIAVTAGDTLRQQKPGSQRWLDKMLTGRWVPTKYTSQEMDELENFHKRAWKHHKIPVSLQREDKKCGNVSFPNLFWFRAVCDPRGGTPCCMNSFCVDKPVQECQCPECYDLRQPVHAEFSKWEPQDAAVQLTPFTREREVCRVLQNKTVYFIGDSFMRQVYTSALAMLRDGKPRHVIKDTVPLVNVTNCDKYFRYLAPCGYFLILDSLECNGTTRLSMRHLYRVTEVDRLFKAVRELNGTVNSWLVVGIGIHNLYNMTAIRQAAIDPMLKLLQNSKWPKLIWMAAQSPGLLKTGSEKRQQSQAILDYNEKLKSIFGPLGIPIMNFFQLTKGVFSFDGAHYGKGLNDVKVNILLNFLQQETTT
ncbi:unnamed protein product [Lymnaea stagnalis]|uniref:Uncharacterized protein n=1 Tax=Lymnaea stagnalis TaxID=6523 RepID=A0AAV2IN72_LYMST